MAAGPGVVHLSGIFVKARTLLVGSIAANEHYLERIPGRMLQAGAAVSGVGVACEYILDV
jgi:hypothetical protein